MDEPVFDELTRDLLLAQDGDRAAFTRVVRRSQPDVARFCQWIIGSAVVVDDLVQDTYLKVFKHLDSFRGESSGRSWILSIARRVCLDQVRRDSRHERVVGAWQGLHRRTPASDTAEAVLHVTDMVSRLPRSLGEAFVLVRIFGFSYNEVSTTLGVPIGTVQSRVARARSALAAMHELDGDESSTRTITPRRHAG